MKKEEVKEEELTKEDLKLISEFINLVSKRGALEAKELFTIGYLFNKIDKLCQ